MVACVLIHDYTFGFGFGLNTATELHLEKVLKILTVKDSSFITGLIIFMFNYLF